MFGVTLVGRFRRPWQLAKSHLKAAVIGLGVAFSVVATFVPITAFHSFLSNKSTDVSSVSSPTAAKKGGAAAKQSKVSNLNTANCLPALQSSDGSFASCPSFALDFATTNLTEATSQYLNPYVGVPIANNEEQYYTSNPSNLRVENGSLVLEAQTAGAPSGYQYTSAKVDTKGKEDFSYGKLIVRAQLPVGVGTWPAIWMLPSQPKYAALSTDPQTAYLNDGELDIAEAVGMQPHLVYSVAHSLMYDDNGVDRTYFNTVLVPDSDTVFHDYEMDWTPTKVTFKIDGNPFFAYAKPANATYQSWPYDQPFYLILNLAVGGDWAGQKGIDSSALPAALRVQSIHYYPYVGVR